MRTESSIEAKYFHSDSDSDGPPSVSMDEIHGGEGVPHLGRDWDPAVYKCFDSEDGKVTEIQTKMSKTTQGPAIDTNKSSQAAYKPTIIDLDVFTSEEDADSDSGINLSASDISEDTGDLFGDDLVYEDKDDGTFTSDAATMSGVIRDESPSNSEDGFSDDDLSQCATAPSAFTKMAIMKEIVNETKMPLTFGLQQSTGKSPPRLVPYPPSAYMAVQTARLAKQVHEATVAADTANIGDRLCIPSLYIQQRQPSPSDAAMVKESVCVGPPLVPYIAPALDLPASKLAVARQFSAEVNGDSIQPQSLGDKTGKHTFFAAREHNKHLIKNAKSPSATVEVVNRTINQALGPRTYSHFTMMSPYDDSLSRHQDTPTPVNAALGLFTPVLSTQDNDDLDMTSAASFNRSRRQVEDRTHTESRPEPSRAALKINDLVEQPKCAAESKGTKRSADQISTLAKGEARAWESAIEAKGLETEGDRPDVALSQSNKLSPVADKIIVATTSVNTKDTNPEHPRSVKRLKRFAEAVGYAALGGAAVGVGLFSVLVATAPDFV